MIVIRALRVALLLGVGALVLVSPAAASPAPTAPPSPAAYPATGGAPARWVCQVATVTADPGDPAADPPRPEQLVTYDDCAVTEWGTDPAPLPYEPVTITQAGDVIVPDRVSLNPDDPVVVGGLALASAGVLAWCIAIILSVAWFITQFAAPPTFGVSVHKKGFSRG